METTITFSDDKCILSNPDITPNEIIIDFSVEFFKRSTCYKLYCSESLMPVSSRQLIFINISPITLEISLSQVLGQYPKKLVTYNMFQDILNDYEGEFMLYTLSNGWTTFERSLVLLGIKLVKHFYQYFDTLKDMMEEENLQPELTDFLKELYDEIKNNYNC